MNTTISWPIKSLNDMTLTVKRRSTFRIDDPAISVYFVRKERYSWFEYNLYGKELSGGFTTDASVLNWLFSGKVDMIDSGILFGELNEDYE